MKRILAILLAAALLFGGANTLVAIAHPARGADVLVDVHPNRLLPDASHLLI
jgi:hypothetical protein